MQFKFFCILIRWHFRQPRIPIRLPDFFKHISPHSNPNRDCRICANQRAYLGVFHPCPSRVPGQHGPGHKYLFRRGISLFVNSRRQRLNLFLQSHIARNLILKEIAPR